MKKRIIKIKKRKKSGLKIKTLIVVISAIVLTTVGIKASDRLFTASVKEAVEFNRCPEEMVFITSENGGFCIDKYENSAGNGCLYSDPQNQTETRKNIENSDCYPISKKRAIPWRNISQNQAAAACAKVNKRLPTNKEWFQAALGTPDQDSRWEKKDCHVSNNWDSQPGLTGSASNCLSSADVYDMVGNLWEWVDGTIFDGKYEGRELPYEGFVNGVDSEGLPYETDFTNYNEDYNRDYFWIRSEGVRGITRGGYWDNDSDAGVYSAYLVFPPSYAGIGVGFRCVK